MLTAGQVKEMRDRLGIWPSAPGREERLNLCDTALAWKEELDAAQEKIAYLLRRYDEAGGDDRRRLVEAAVRAGIETEHARWMKPDGSQQFAPEVVAAIAARVLAEHDAAQRGGERG